MKIAVVAGGDSSEYKVSLKSGKNVADWIGKAGFKAYLVVIRGLDWYVQQGRERHPINKDDFSFQLNGEQIRFDYAWNTIHGSPGENGILQGYFSLQKIPHSSSDTLTSALTFNKFSAKAYMRQFNIQSAEAKVLRKNREYNIEELMENVGLPCFVKPNNGGSSFGISKVNQHEQLQPAIDMAFKEDNEVIIESFIKGREITCGLYRTREKLHVFPLTEIISENEFFDYDAKYEGASQEITPADLEEDLARKIQQLSVEIYDHFNCKGLVRVDFIIKGNQVYFLEINTVPGMSAESIVPQQIRADGHSVEEVIKWIIEDHME